MQRSRIVVSMVGVILASAVIGLVAAHSHGRRASESSVGRFDYYLMSLSWSPSFCLTHADERDQCNHQGFGFVLHGLWPQNRNGSWPQDCPSDASPDAGVIARTLSFMPSRHLIAHEWTTHGACTGLDPADYFALADRAFASVKVPPALAAPQSPPNLSADELIAAFVSANPELHEGMLSVACREGDELSEVRVCLNRESLRPEACGGRVRNSCRYGKLTIPAAR